MTHVCRLRQEMLPRRFVEIGKILTPDLLEKRLEGDELVLVFRRSPERIHDLAMLVAEESECCPFLDFELSIPPDDAPARLRFRAPPDARGLLEAFARAAAAVTPTSTTTLR